MATVLFTWELGGGLGHLMRIAPLAKGLADRGHHVYLAARDLWSLKTVLGDCQIRYLSAPFRLNEVPRNVRIPRTFAHILLNVGFDDDRGLAALTRAWQTLYHLVKPDAIVFDHSPTALLSARACPARRIVMGTGFCVPPIASPWPDLRSWLPPSGRISDGADEAELLERVNRLLDSWHQPALARMCDLYGDADETFLTTFRELDHYPDRAGATYCGPVNAVSTGGKVPVWPNAPGAKVFGYLKMFPALTQFLEALQKSKQPSLIYADGIPREIQSKFASATMRFETERLDMATVIDRCDLAITNGTFATTAAMLMAAKPLFMLPVALEQLILARRVADLGAGTYVSVREEGLIEPRLGALLQYRARFTQRALELRAAWCDFDAGTQQQKIISRIEQLSTPS